MGGRPGAHGQNVAVGILISMFQNAEKGTEFLGQGVRACALQRRWARGRGLPTVIVAMMDVPAAHTHTYLGTQAAPEVRGRYCSASGKESGNERSREKAIQAWWKDQDRHREKGAGARRLGNPGSLVVAGDCLLT